ncbi:mechanosensitive ion channel domain-containing protein [Bordetella sp. H567]|uniref:mechanosensitive ion channel domain-containing protein n=1 Tax=Bordetella sp. H567 TaxID=1697043 RepID=UPI0008349D73|nr:mechanosensitive ion channel domain-containing protein [Bordetella sp. H567]
MRISEILRAGLAFAAFSLFLHGAAEAQHGVPPPSAAVRPAVTPAEARHTADILRDDAKRAALIQTLDTIAAAAPAGPAPAATTAGGQGSSATPASLAPTGAVPSAAPQASPAPEEKSSIVPLESDGLMARMLRSLDQWMDNFAAQMREAAQAAKQIPALLTHSRAVATDAGQRLLALLALSLAAAFAAGLVLEWVLHRALRRPRRALEEHANRQAMRRPTTSAPPATPAATPADPASDTAQAGLAPPSEGVAVIQTQRDGVDHVETIPVGKQNAAGSIPVSAPPPSPDPDAARTREARNQSWQQNSRHHWRTLRNMPYAIGALMLQVLPIALFFLGASLTLRYVASDHPHVRQAITGFIAAYVVLRLTMAVVRLLVSPAGQGLRLLDISPATAHVLLIWTRWIAGLALFGMAIADTIPLLGTAPGLRMAFLKAVSLLVHLSAVVLVLKLRRPIRQAVRGAPDASGPLAAARSWLAEAWAAIAIVLIMGVWVVWALGVEDGFPKLIHFVLISAAVLVVARLLAILILGSLGRLFSTGPDAGHGDDATAARGSARLSDRYYPWTRGLVSVVLTLCTIVVLFESWGIDALGWFASGSLGRSLASAALTIVIAIIIAILVWEAVQYAVERRLARWTRQGDVVRAARLRTLLPMLRTALFIVVALIVGLTALNEIGINTTPLLAGASIVGVALGFGSQKLVQDFITGIFLLMENAMRVGDWVTVAGVSGSVEYLSIRTVRLRGGDGALYIVPFSSVSTVSNSNRGIGNAAVRISVAYDTDIDMVVRELKQIGASLREDPNFKDQILNDLEVWGVDSVDGSMVTLVGQMRCSDKGRWGVQREINRRILERFRELGIEIANPRASLLLPPDASPLVAPANETEAASAHGPARAGNGAGQRRTS